MKVNDAIHDKLLKSSAFPSLPAIAIKLLSIKNTADTKALIELLSNDQELNNQILNYAKLPFLNNNSKRQITDVQDAVNHVLGFDTVSHIALGVTAVRAFKFEENSALSLEKFWQHAFLSAVLCDYFAKLAVKSINIDSDTAYLAGLFHNFGFLLFSYLYPPEFRLLMKWSHRNPKVSIHILEKKLLGMGLALHILRGGHAELGAWLLAHWGMPENICIITREHHSINYTGEHAAYVKLIQLVNQVLKSYNIGDGIGGKYEAKLLKTLGLTVEVVNTSVNSIILPALSSFEKNAQQL